MEIVIVVFVLAGLIAVFLLGKFFYKKFSSSSTPKVKVAKEKKKKPVKEKSKKEQPRKNTHLVVVEKYMFRREVLFWKFLNSILPRTVIVCPKVAVTSIVMPDGDKKFYNELMDKTVDYVVFDEQTMSPMLIIDIYDSTYDDAPLEERDPKVYESLESVRLKILSLKIQTYFDKEEIKTKIFKALNITTGADSWIILSN